MNKTFKEHVPRSAHGYEGFPLDHIVNFTSVPGYLIPIAKQILDPGDKVKISTYLRTITQPLASPAMATIIERIEWFAVPIEQLYRPFATKYYGINDVDSDLLDTSYNNDQLPAVKLDDLNYWMINRPLNFVTQASLPVTQPTYSEAKRLCDALGYPASVGDATSGVNFLQSVNALFPAAYQKIYYDHYRLTDREVNDPKAYNFDSIGLSNGTPFITNASPGYRLNKLYMLRKRPYRRDYFTSLKVSPLMGNADVNAIGNDLTALNQWLTGLTGASTAISGGGIVFSKGGAILTNSNTTPSTVQMSGVSSSSNASITNAADMARAVVSPANIRSLFAIEKLLEVTRRAKKHYDMQTLAHFGVSVPKGLSGECIKIGTHEQYIKINDVISTATTSQGALGERAGIGASTGQSKTFHFEAKCHCILMGIYSAEPLMSYPQKGLDRLNSKVKASEFYKPEYDSLGLQPVFGQELMCYPIASGAQHNMYNVVGWQDRYSELKASFNRSFGGINTTFFKEWVCNRYVASPDEPLNKHFYEVWPSDMNEVFQVPYTGSVTSAVPEDVFEFDLLINQAYINIVKVSKKSIHGTPNL